MKKIHQKKILSMLLVIALTLNFVRCHNRIPIPKEELKSGRVFSADKGLKYKTHIKIDDKTHYANLQSFTVQDEQIVGIEAGTQNTEIKIPLNEISKLEKLKVNRAGTFFCGIGALFVVFLVVAIIGISSADFSEE